MANLEMNLNGVDGQIDADLADLERELLELQASGEFFSLCDLSVVSFSVYTGQAEEAIAEAKQDVEDGAPLEPVGQPLMAKPLATPLRHGKGVGYFTKRAGSTRTLAYMASSTFGLQPEPEKNQGKPPSFSEDRTLSAELSPHNLI